MDKTSEEVRGKELGVPQDEREAFIWYSVAAANGHKGAAERLHEVDWDEYLSVDELREAREEAKQKLKEFGKEWRL